MTWPIAARIDRDLPHDLGDPAFVAGVLAWGAEHWLALFSGDLSAPVRFWNGPIFSPESLTIAYSEHFALHSLMTLPVYAATRNPVLCYNLVFLSTYVIGALGMYLLVREFVGERHRFSPPAFVAGLAFAFSPYRVATLPHLQVLSSQWMPFALLGLHRYFKNASTDGLVGAGAALWAQNLSSGYYMLFFTPFAVLFALTEMAIRRTWNRIAIWRDLAIMLVVTVLATLPFALPYLERTRGTRRAVMEVSAYSADLQSWMTASPMLLVWGQLQTFPKAEGVLFLGVGVVVLAVLGAIYAWKVSRVVAVFGGITVVLSFWLAFGPQVRIGGEATGFPALYAALMQLPGFNAARVPARFATITMLALAILSGAALAMFDRGRRRGIIALAGVVVLAEGAAFPLPTNSTWTSSPNEYFEADKRLYRLSDAPPVYGYIRRLDERAVIAHFPFGLPEREIQYGYYAMLHGRPIINGYSGAFPATYSARMALLANPLAADRESVRLLLELDRVSHIVVHLGAYNSDRGEALLAFLPQLGWRQTARFANDVVFTR